MAGGIDCIVLDSANRLLVVGFFGFSRFSPDGTPELASSSSDLRARAVVELPDNRVLLAGFYFNPQRLVRLNSSLIEDFATNGPNSIVEGLLLQPDGKVIAFGWFSMFGGVPVGRVLRLNADMTLDTTFTASVGDGIVECGVLQGDGKIVIAGSFSSVGGVSRNRIARLNTNGTLDESFTAEVSSRVTDMTIDGDQRIYLSGFFTFVNGSARERIVRLHPNGDLDTGFDAGTGPDSPANTIAIAPDGNVVLGGRFTNYNGVARSRIAKVSGGLSIPEGPLITVQPTGTNVLAGFSPVLSVRASGGPRLNYQWYFNSALLAGETRQSLTLTNIMPQDSGQYSVIVSNELGVLQSDVVSVNVLTFPPDFVTQPTNVARLAGQNAYFVTTVTGAPPPILRWYHNGNVVTGQSSATLTITNVSPLDAGEYFLIATNFLRSATSVVVNLSVSIVSNPGAVDNTFGPEQLPRLNATNVTAAAIQPDGKVLIARGLAVYRLLDDGRVDPGFTNFFADDRIEALAVQPDGKVLVGGAFRSLHGSRFGLARLETNGVPDTSFQVSYADRRVQAMAMQSDGKVLVASGTPSFPMLGRFPLLSRLLPDGSSDVTFQEIWVSTASSFPSQTNIYGLELQSDAKILLDSTFGFRRLLPHGGVDIAFRGFEITNLVDSPRVMALQNDGRILVGGTKRGTNVACVFRLNRDGSLDPGFNPGPTGARIVALLSAQDGKIVIAGSFTNIQGAVRHGVARLLSDGMLDYSFDVGIGPVVGTNAVVRKILPTPAGQLVLAGAFAQFNDYERPGVVRLLNDPAAAPRVVTPPLSQSVHIGQYAGFSADVSWMPAGFAQWFFNDAAIEGATNFSIRIDNVQPSDAGAYRLSVSNALGAVTSAPAILTVTSAPAGAGAVDPAFYPGAEPNGSVLAAIPQPDGKVIIGGTFTKVDGVTRNRIARLNPNGTLDLTFPVGLGVTNTFDAPTPAVRAFALQPDGKIIVGGTLGYVDGQLRPSIARLNSDGSLDATFVDQLWGSQVNILFQQRDGKVVVGGAGYVGFGRLHADGTVDSNFVRQWEPFGAVRVEQVHELPDGKLLVASTSTAAAETNGLKRLETNGVLDTTFLTVRSSVRSFIVLEDSILIGGAFTNIHGAPSRYLAALAHDGSLLSNQWSTVVLSDSVRHITRDLCGRMLVSGSFATVNGQRHVGLARFFEHGALDGSFAPEFDGEVRAVTSQMDFRAFVAGEFTEISGVARRGLARVVEDVPTPPVLVTQPTNQALRAGTVLSLVTDAECAGRQVFQWQHNGVNIPGATNRILDYPNARTDLRGDFRVTISNAAGVVTSSVATVSIAPHTTMPGDNDINFFPQYAPTGGVRAIGLRTDGKLMVAGYFPDGDLVKRFHSNGSVDATFSPWPLPEFNPARPRLVAPEPQGTTLVCFDMEIGPPLIFRFDPDGFTPPTSFLTPHWTVHALTVRPDGTIYFAGDFHWVGTNRSPGLARVSASGQVDTTFAANLPEGLLATAMALASDGSIIAARRVQEGSAVSRFHSTGTLDTTFSESIVSNSVSAVAVQSDGRILVAGDFTNFSGVARPHLVRLNTSGSLDLSFSSAVEPGDRITEIAVQPDDRILICGTNTAGAPIANRGILRLQRDGALDSTFDPGAGANGPVTSLALSPSGSVYLAGQFDSYDGFARPSLARAHGNPRGQFAALANDVFTLSLYTDLDRTYHLETRAALDGNQWTTVQSVTGSGDVQTLRDVNAGGMTRFYRVRVD